ncbi:hypothetical protein BIW11_10821, partial [Tropilaelaps mercedesae]
GRFAETVLESVLWRAVIAQLAPMSMENRLTLFPPGRLDVVLTHLLKHKAIVSRQSGPFATLDYAQVAALLDRLADLRDAYSNNSETLVSLLCFIDNAVVLCRPIADFFINMESRVKLIETMAFRLRLDRNKVDGIPAPRTNCQQAHALREPFLQNCPVEKSPSAPVDRPCPVLRSSGSASSTPSEEHVFVAGTRKKRVRFTKPLCVAVLRAPRRTQKAAKAQGVLKFAPACKAGGPSYDLRSKTKCKGGACSACAQ